MCIRVTHPDVDDMKNPKRVMMYLQLKKYLPITIEANGDIHVIKWWIDGSYGVHPNMKIHTGATISLGKGSIYSSSTMQKFNTKSSTEAELVGVDDLMPMKIWIRQFSGSSRLHSD